MRDKLIELIKAGAKAAIEAGDLPAFEIDDCGIERPGDVSNGDWSSTVALKSAKAAHKSPRDIATAIVAHIPADGAVEKIEIAGPGFINFYLTQSAITEVFNQVRAEGKDFGKGHAGDNKVVNLEWISANPVGPFHVGHGRWAALGEALSRVMEHSGWTVQREFYINDAGSQMDVFGNSIALRYQQLADIMKKQGVDANEAKDILEADRVANADDEAGTADNHPYSNEWNTKLENSYGGEYIIDFARDFMLEDEGAQLEKTPEEQMAFFRENGYKRVLKNMSDICTSCGVNFDVWYSERNLHKGDGEGTSPVAIAFDKLRKEDLIYDKDGATWFRATKLGDEQDRVVVKANGEHTYFSSDIAYHFDKFQRGCDLSIDIWGADHHGYVPRVQAAVAAMGYPGQFEVVLGQLVNLLRGGKPVRMSKRRGTMITFEELLDEVGKDSTFFTLLSRSSDQEIDFDIDIAKSRSNDNPVFYVQYAHARICSILAKAAGVENTGNLDMAAVADKAINGTADMSLLTDESEIALARLMSTFGDLVESCERDRAPFRLTHFSSDLASAFHSFYTRCHVITEDEELTRARLVLCDATRQLLELSLYLLDVSAPQKM